MIDNGGNQGLAVYQRLPCTTSFLDAIEDPGWTVPASWFVAVTDVVDSTVAVQEGKYKEVNVSGAMTIIALGRVFSSLDFPFLFGGDGMSALIPHASVGGVRIALSRAVRDIESWFGLRLRAALLPLTLISGTTSLSKVQISRTYRQAVFHGDQLGVAEALLKERTEDPMAEKFRITAAIDDSPGDYEGFTCRWQDIPTHKAHTIALVVSFRSAGSGSDAIREIDAIFAGSEGGLHPVAAPKLIPGGPASRYKLTPLISSGGKRWSLKYAFVLIREILTIRVIRICIRFNIPLSAGIYKVNKVREQNVNSSDFRKFDGGLKMILSVSENELSSLVSLLDRRFSSGELFFGIHSSNAAHMTCVANLPSGDDIHFVDATDGGYTMAATAMKRRLPQPDRSDPQNL